MAVQGTLEQRWQNRVIAFSGKLWVNFVAGNRS